MSHQLPLDFKFLDSATFTDFFAGRNQELLLSLHDFLDLNNKQEFFYLWGKTQVGKTHLLQACCHYALSNNIQAMYVSLNNIYFTNNTVNLEKLDDFFQGLDQISLLCLDDIDCIAKHRVLEEKLFYLFNNIRSNSNKLIIAAKLSPNNLDLSLPDLKSRLAWGITYHLQELTDQEKIAALRLRAERIGLQLGENVANFLLARMPRDTGQLFNMLKRLDTASLIAIKRKLTIPFVRSVLGISNKEGR